MVRAAILDDYQNVALKVADWSTVNKDVEVKVFNAPLGDDNAVIKALQGFTIVNMMRERTPFNRKVIEGLPDMKLLITTGARNDSIDLKACRRARRHRLRHRRLRQPDRQHRHRSDAGAHPPHRLRKRPHESRRALADRPSASDVEGMTLGILGLGKLGQRVATIAKALGMKVIAWSQNLTPEKAKEARRRLRLQGGPVSQRRCPHHPRACSATARAAWSARANSG